MSKKKPNMVIETDCEVWVVSWMSETGMFGTWGLYGTEKAARKVATELEKIRKVPTKTRVTSIPVDIEQKGVFGPFKVIDPIDVREPEEN